MGDDGEREKGLSANETSASAVPVEPGGHAQDEKACDGEGRRRRLLIRVCAGSVAVLTLVFGCVWLGTSARPGSSPDADAPTNATSAETDDTEEEESSPESENGEAGGKGDREMEAEFDEVPDGIAPTDDGVSSDTDSTSNAPSGPGGSFASNPPGRGTGSTSSGSSGSASGGGSSSGGMSRSQPQHTHSWVAQTSTVHRDAVYQTAHHDAVTEERTICNNCGADISGNVDAHMKANILNGCGSYTVKSVVVQAAYDEQVLVSTAYDETVVTGYTCSGCGATK